MLTESEKTTIQKMYKSIALLKPGFTPWHGQREMMGLVANTFGEGVPHPITLIEAPTGTGKTLGYLIPSAVLSYMRNRRLVISTATVALQDQIRNDDMPLLIKLMQAQGFNLRVSVLKGQERYVCPTSLDARAAAASDLFEGEPSQFAIELQKTLNDHSWNGERESVPMLLKDAQWRDVCARRGACSASSCSSYKKCPHAAAQAEAEAAHIVLVNHDLLLSNFKQPTKTSWLTDLSKNFYVIDEAHHLGEKALSIFAQSLKYREWESETAWLIAIAARSTGIAALNRIGASMPALTGAVKALKKLTLGIVGKSDVYRFKDRLPLELCGALKVYQARLKLLKADFESLKTEYSERYGDQKFKQIEARLLIAISIVDGDLGFIETAEEEDDARALWFEKTPSSHQLMLSPYEPGKVLRRILWKGSDDSPLAVLCSATLFPLGQSKTQAQKIGLGLDYNELKIASRFTPDQLHVHLPRCSEPHEKAHSHDVVTCFRANVGDDGGVLFAFASKRQLGEVYELLTTEERSWVLRQGDDSVARLLEIHKARINNGQRSVLFGLATLSEGIDLPGKWLTKVVVVKVPFPSPDEPLIAAQSDALEAQGLSSFGLVSLPAAAIRLAQTAGRAVRSISDYSVLIILDPRIRTKAYGRQLLNALPAHTLVTA